MELVRRRDIRQIGSRISFFGRPSASSRDETKRKRYKQPFLKLAHPNKTYRRSLIPRLASRPGSRPTSLAGSSSEPATELDVAELLGLSEESLEQQPVFEEEEQGESLEEAPAAPSPSDTV